VYTVIEYVKYFVVLHCYSFLVIPRRALRLPYPLQVDSFGFVQVTSECEYYGAFFKGPSVTDFQTGIHFEISISIAGSSKYSNRVYEIEDVAFHQAGLHLSHNNHPSGSSASCTASVAVVVCKRAEGEYIYFNESSLWKAKHLQSRNPIRYLP